MKPLIYLLPCLLLTACGSGSSSAPATTSESTTQTTTTTTTSTTPPQEPVPAPQTTPVTTTPAEANAPTQIPPAMPSMPTLMANPMITQANLDKVEKDMSSTMVKSILGEPTSSENEPIPIVGGIKTTYHYQTPTATVTVIFKNDQVQQKMGSFNP